MIKHTTLKSILTFIPKIIREQESDSTLLTYALEAYRDLKTDQRFISKVSILPIVDHKVSLPVDLNRLMLLTYHDNNQENTCTNTLMGCIDEEVTETTPCTNCQTYDNFTGAIVDSCNSCYNIIKKVPLNYQLFLESQFFNYKTAPLKYVGNADGLLCKDCPNKQVDCRDTFSYDPLTRELVVSCEDGWICLVYEAEIRDSDGNFLIVDHPKVRAYIRNYMLYMHWENRLSAKEENSIRMSDRYLNRCENTYRSAKGALNQRTIDFNVIMSIDNINSPLARMLKLR